MRLLKRLTTNDIQLTARLSFSDHCKQIFMHLVGSAVPFGNCEDLAIEFYYLVNAIANCPLGMKYASLFINLPYLLHVSTIVRTINFIDMQI